MRAAPTLIAPGGPNVMILPGGVACETGVLGIDWVNARDQTAGINAFRRNSVINLKCRDIAELVQQEAEGRVLDCVICASHRAAVVDGIELCA
jgi:hypothetical protein